MNEHAKTLKKQVLKPQESKLKKAAKQFGKYAGSVALATAMTLSPFTVDVGKLARGKPPIELKKAFAQITVSLAELEKLDKECEENGWRDPINNIYYDYYSGSFLQNILIPIPGENWKLVATLIIKSNRSIYEIFVSIVNEQGQRGAIKIPLNILAEAYKKFSGQEMRYARLIGEQGYSNKYGQYTNIYIVPVSEPNGEIKPNSPIIQVSYVFGKIYDSGNEPLIVSPR